MAEPKTLKASELITLLSQEIQIYGDCPIFITAGAEGITGELPLDDNSLRFASRVGYHKNRNQKEIETLEGKFFILADVFK